MTPAEKIYSEERENRSIIVLRPEGMFYRAYERSAYLVCKSIKEFKPTKRFYKNIGQEIVSIGFPKDTYPKYLGERTAVVDSDGTIRVQCGMELDEGLFESWKQSLPLASAKESRHSFEGDRIQVYRESYALMMKVFDSLVNVSRDFKQIPGEDIRRGSLNLVRSVLKANDARDDSGRKEEIGKALESVEDIKLLLRILCDLHQISPGNYMLMSGMAVSISGQLKAWASYSENNDPQKRQGRLQTEGHGFPGSIPEFSGPSPEELRR